MQQKLESIRELQSQDLDACAALLIEAYNAEPWKNHWTRETAVKYLREFAESKNFVGFVVAEGGEIIGAEFAHVKTWWTNDELFVDELFIRPEMQRKGFGRALLQHAEDYARSRGLAGVTLLTSKYMPAKAFYDKNGYLLAEHVIFMYKLVNSTQ